jgi:SDR family mycofactocin-dependent oxidoreductase
VQLGISFASVARIWRKWNIQPAGPRLAPNGVPDNRAALASEQSIALATKSGYTLVEPGRAGGGGPHGANRSGGSLVVLELSGEVEMGRMDGKVALITGAGRGQGRSHALTLAREGADILAFDCPAPSPEIPYELSKPDDLRETVKLVEALDRRIISVEGDVRNQADLDDLLQHGISEFGHIDVCIANAGVWSIGNLWEFTEAQWLEVVDVCLNGVWRTLKAIVPHMIEREEGSIVIISSVVGVEGGDGLAHYTAAKHGVLGLMKSACLELGPKYGIRCNAILPGIIDTPIIKWQGALDQMAGGEGLGTLEILKEGPKVWAAIKGRGVLSPQATSNAVLFLASDESKDISGLELLVDAGHRVLPGLNQTAMAAAGT